MDLSSLNLDNLGDIMASLSEEDMAKLSSLADELMGSGQKEKSRPSQDDSNFFSGINPDMMAKMMSIPVLGIVENMSYFECPDCKSRHSIYGESHLGAVAETHDIDTVARIPIDRKLAAASDAGTIELYDGDWLNELFTKIEEV